MPEKEDLLRFTTAGSVDDGKSTLIGRLLYDSKSIFEDQLASVTAASQKKGLDHLDLSLLTDGLRDERIQGITIDVAYRYYSTPRRKFIIADTPGHIQYTRNMVTGASTANLAILLVDARHGVVEQTRRHSFIASLLQIQHLVLCVNKMDLVGYSQTVFEEIISAYSDFASRMEIPDVTCIPVSALHGDNIVNRSEQMLWYNGPTLLYHLEHVQIANDTNHVDMRFPVQTVIRPQTQENPDFRGYAGKLVSGILRKGETVMALPSGFTSTITALHLPDRQTEEAFAPQSIVVELADDIDISRGDMLVRPANQPVISQDVEAMLCWLDNHPVHTGTRLVLRHTSREVKCVLKEILYRVDMHTLSRQENSQQLSANDIARVRLRTTSPLFMDSYRKNRPTGAFILIDEGTNVTVAAGMVV
ncbi:MAG: GTP-binding protein [Saprospiraceae bacterium]|nr:GTP-binding protein [Saprospiraceae bacterium]